MITTGTVIDGGDISEAVETFTNTREYKCDNNGECVMPIGEVTHLCDHDHVIHMYDHVIHTVGSMIM